MRTATLLILGAALALSGASLYQAWAQSMTHYPGSSYFPDVTPGTSYDHNIGYAVEYGVINGFPDGTYAPNLSVTRAQMPTFVMRQTVGDLNVCWMLLDVIYFDGYYTGDSAYQAGRITWDQYQAYESVRNWYVEMEAYQIAQMGGSGHPAPAALPESLPRLADLVAGKVHP
jgi:hypothetical protein